MDHWHGPVVTDRARTLADRLGSARKRTFVGRATERALFRSALEGGEDTFSVLYLHGPGGIGKTTLLRRLGDDARAAGRRVVQVDGRTVEATPAGFSAEAADAMSVGGVVLLIDTFEHCQGLEPWLRTRFLPQLPFDAVVVIAGRLPPDARWRVDPDWNDALRVISIGGLSPDEARALVATRNVAPAFHKGILASAGGHPLALTLAAEAAAGEYEGWGTGASDRDMVRVLLSQLVGEVPSHGHRRVLEACALVETTTLEMLREIAGSSAEELFDWLYGLPFTESGRNGVFPHDVVRDPLIADLRWRDPSGFGALLQRLHTYLVDRVRSAPENSVMEVTRSLIYLYRTGSGVADYVTWTGGGGEYEDVYRPEHRATVLRLACEAEGPESARLAEFWLARQPEGFRLYRRVETDEVIAFMAWLRLHSPDGEEIAADPVVAAAWQHVQTHSPSRAGEHITVSRFAVDPASAGRTSPAVDLMVTRSTAEWLRARRVSWSFMTAVDAEFWRPQMTAVEHEPIALDIRVGRQRTALFGHDWRVRPVDDWLDRLSGELVSGELEPAPPGSRILPRDTFDTAVRSALRDLADITALRGNPLCSTRLAEDGPALRTLVTDAVEALADPYPKQHRAVRTTYLQRVPTQEAAAERLQLPFSTYRRHLTAGVTAVCERLWEIELDTE
ncbi:ATP-binding protein [Catenulispora sp. NL8]|uniref:ATP-binding protein n=1 Tax=Catenulispora pinistramenti TaxID=2705254 RepID=A0ABS5KQP4_9ACTN|nr:ATP-binding protein [Catenulispora pinistramenti]MBS2548320.1 ATP-binding protein [Catenulispora pinistramenti]